MSMDLEGYLHEVEQVYHGAFARKLRQALKVASAKSVNVRPLLLEKSKELSRTKQHVRKFPGVPDFAGVHRSMVYPGSSLSPAECAINGGICTMSKSTHDTDHMIWIMKLLQNERYQAARTVVQNAKDKGRRALDHEERCLHLKRIRILPAFVFNSMDMKDSTSQETIAKTFRTHVQDQVGKGYGQTFQGHPGPNGKYILLMECGHCGNGTDLFAAVSNWGHRVLLIFDYNDHTDQFVHNVEYYDSLGDWALHPNPAQRKPGISISQYILNVCVKPMCASDAKLVIMPCSESVLPSDFPSSVVPVHKSSRKHKRKNKVFVQHPDEYLCQNWVVFFADARMANVSVSELIQWFQLYRPYDGFGSSDTPFGTDYAFMVFFHLYHLRRLVHFQAPLFQSQEHMSVPDHLHYNMFGIKWDEMQPDFFLPYIGATFEALNAHAQQLPYMKDEDMPFPPDSYEYIIDPLGPLLWFVKDANRSV